MIKSLKFNEEATEITLSLDGGALTYDTLHIWSSITYKGTSYIDLSSKLTAAAAQTVTIEPSDLDCTSFNTLYFVELELSGGSKEFGLLSNHIPYLEYIMKKALYDFDCGDVDDCEFYPFLYDSLVLALGNSLYEEAATIAKKLDTTCKCTSYENRKLEVGSGLGYRTKNDIIELL